MDLLAHLSCFVPGALRGLHARLLDLDILSRFAYPYVLQHGVIFRGGDSDTRDRLSALAAEAPDERVGDHALSSLAWVDDDEVPRLFLRFHEDRPPWASQWFSAPWYALRAGWALLRNGQGQPLLLTSDCRRLERGVETASPVEVIFRVEQECGGCAGPLSVLLDLDLGDEQLTFLGLSGDRLRVLTCERCVCFGTVYAAVDLGGSAKWMEESVKPEDPPEWAYEPERQLGLGLERRTPFEAHAFANHMSQVGGQAGWIQNPDYPQCPRCQRLMPSVAQVDLSEFELGEGMIYAFFDPDCGIVATLFQQS
ncbi:MAG: hypothetical protein M3376_10625 [Actinomycetota bacterium]|nr:hypothetical protein [Actinomycetota bacterium]